MKKDDNMWKFEKYLFAAMVTVCFVAMPIEAAAADKAADKAASALPIQLGAPFRDGAVLQRGMEVPVWGWGKPGTSVTVAFAGQSNLAVAGEDGKWVARLDAMKASFDPREMVISEQGGKRVTLTNILVGEVWLASGQSNMRWTVNEKHGTSCMQLKTEPRNGVAPIREFTVSNCYAQLHPIERTEGAWKTGNYEDYSAIAYAFAHKLLGELDVPIGILNCTKGETTIQAWVPREGWATANDAHSKAIHQQCLKTDPTTPEHKIAWDAYYKEVETAVKAGKPLPHGVPGNLRSNRDASWLYNGRLSPVVPYAIRGAIWNQGYANTSEGISYYNNLHSLIRGWRTVWNRPDPSKGSGEPLPVYFHQFYSPGSGDAPSIDSWSEMRLGTWLARDIPNAGMASQIDIGGSVHYKNKAVPGIRLALHALKNQYPSTVLRAGGKAKDIVAEGPMYKDYTVDGDKVIVEFTDAEGGLIVADTAFNRSSADGATGMADPIEIPNGEDKVRLFWLAGEDRVWHPATFKIDGDKVVVSSPAVKNPRGISYGSGGIGFQPCLYNKALLPMTPFIHYDHQLVTSKAWPEVASMVWPDGKLKLVGESIDPGSVGILDEWRKMPLLPPQFRENGVLQAGVPITFWGSTRKYGEQGGRATGKAEVHFEFGDIKKILPVNPDVDGWNLTIDPLEATSKPRTLTVRFMVDGELYHERIVPGIVVGDVWYVAGSDEVAPEKSNNSRKDGEVTSKANADDPIIRMITNESKRYAKNTPSRYSVAVSRTPKTRFASYWKPATGFAAALGEAIHAKTGHPVGIILMPAKPWKGRSNPSLKAWIHYSYLNQAPSLMDDYKVLAAKYPGTEYYQENVMKYLSAWKDYWDAFIPEMMATKAVPDGEPWGWYPTFRADGDSKAAQVFNVSTEPFTPAGLKGAIFLTCPKAVAEAEGAVFGEQMSALANCWIGRFGGAPLVVYAQPSQMLVPRISKPESIKGQSLAVEIDEWADRETAIIKAIKGAYGN